MIIKPTKGLSCVHTNACWMKLCVPFSCFRVGVLAEQSAELAQASGTPTCSDTPGPARFLFLATVLFVQQTWTETELTLTFLNVQQPKHMSGTFHHWCTSSRQTSREEGVHTLRDNLFNHQHKKWWWFTGTCVTLCSWLFCMFLSPNVLSTWVCLSVKYFCHVLPFNFGVCQWTTEKNNFNQSSLSALWHHKVAKQNSFTCPYRIGGAGSSARPRQYTTYGWWANLTASKRASSISNSTISKQFIQETYLCLSACLTTQSKPCPLEQYILWQSRVMSNRMVRNSWHDGFFHFGLSGSLFHQTLALSTWFTIFKWHKFTCHSWAPWESSAQV